MSSRSPCDVSDIEVVESSGKEHKADSSGSPCAGLEGDCASLDDDDEIEGVNDGTESSEPEEAERVKFATRSEGDFKVLPRVLESVLSMLASPSASDIDLDIADSFGRFVGTRLGSLGLLDRFFLVTDLQLDEESWPREEATFGSVCTKSRYCGRNIVHGRRSLSWCE